MHKRNQRGRCDETEEIFEVIETEKFPEITKKILKCKKY